MSSASNRFIYLLHYKVHVLISYTNELQYVWTVRVSFIVLFMCSIYSGVLKKMVIHEIIKGIYAFLSTKRNKNLSQREQTTLLKTLHKHTHISTHELHEREKKEIVTGCR